MAAHHKSSGKHHIVMLPYMAQGHIVPFLNLSILLASRRGFIVTIANTPLNILSMRRRIQSAPQTKYLDIRLAELPFSSADHGLPPNNENTDTLPPHLTPRLIMSSVHLQAHLEQLLRLISAEEGRPPLCIISDMFFGWTLDVASSFRIPRITFCTTSALATAVMYSLWIHRPHLEAESREHFALPDLPDLCLHRSQISAVVPPCGEEGDDYVTFVVGQIKRNLGSWGTLFNTVEALEYDMLHHNRSMTGRPVWSVGPLSLLPSLPPSRELKASTFCLEWLDSHSPSSVLYICFGSQNSISARNMQELAIGLESARRPFVWVVRPPLGFPLNSEFCAEFLPVGFEERMAEKKQGLIIKGWAPQLMILSHPSTGGFVSHCGWNSFVESLSHGVPVLGWPLTGDQFFNSMLSKMLGVGVEMTRGFEGEVGKEDVEKNVKMLIEEKKGMEMRWKAIQLRDEMIRAVAKGKNAKQKGSSICDIDDMIAKLVSHCQQ